MEARTLRAAVAIAAVLALISSRPLCGQSVRSQNFVVSAPTRELANEICQHAERFRRDLAIEWLGKELPPWTTPCPIRANVAQNLGAGGATTFVFRGGAPGDWTMDIQGSRERILDSVLPHEVTHTIFATHFGRPLPRWADEGACTTVEHASERAKQDKFLIQFLTPDARGNTRGIPFNQMFRMKEYPKDILPLYSQGYSLARYFIQQGGKRKFVNYVGEGMQANDWPTATQKYYGYSSLSELQVAWVDWVRKGSPRLDDPSALASAAAANNPAQPGVGMTQLASLSRTQQSRIPDGALASWQTPQAQNARSFAEADRYETPPAPSNFAAPAPTNFAAAEIGRYPPQASGDYSKVSRPVSDGWYARRRDQAQAVLNGSGPADAAAEASPGQASATMPQPREQVPPPPTRPASVEAQRLTPISDEKPAAPLTPPAAASAGDRRVLLEWSRPANQPYRGGADLTGVVLADTSVMRR
jgi:hypothetical protein